MRSSVLRTMGVGVTALALTTSLAGMASASDPDVVASSTAVSKTVFAPLVTPDRSCFNNNDGATGNLISSQNFEKANNAFDDEAADDFKLRDTCRIKSIDVLGAYFVPETDGPADSQTVTFYENRRGKPGAKIESQKVQGTDNAGTFNIPLNTVVLQKGTYWVSVVINMDADTKGQWGWAATANQKGNPAVWRNPNGGFESGCEKWKDMQTCIGITGAPDFVFQLNS